MQPPSPLAPNTPPDKGLPPVAPPSGRFIVQLFLVPGLIVAVVVCALLFFNWMVGGETAPDELLNRLESSSADVRWRTANEVAQRLTRDDNLASDPTFGIRLVELLTRRLKEYDDAKASLAQRLSTLGEDEIKKEYETLKEKRKEIQFLSPCLGTLIVPIGAPLLCKIADRDRDDDEKAIVAAWRQAARRITTETPSETPSLILLRRQAVWALANLGENTKRFEKLADERREWVIDTLKQQAASGPAEVRDAARQCAGFLQALEKKERPSSMGAIDTLARCAAFDDYFLRELVAQAFNFWDGDKREDELAEKTLVGLANDTSKPKLIEVGDDD